MSDAYQMQKLGGTIEMLLKRLEDRGEIEFCRQIRQELEIPLGPPPNIKIQLALAQERKNKDELRGEVEKLRNQNADLTRKIRELAQQLREKS